MFVRGGGRGVWLCEGEGVVLVEGVGGRWGGGGGLERESESPLVGVLDQGPWRLSFMVDVEVG